MKIKLLSLLLGTIVLFGSTADAGAQSPSAMLSVGIGSGMPGDAVSVSVSLSSLSGAQVAGLNFDVGFDSGQLEFQNVSIGSAASSVDKSLYSSTPSSSSVRVIIIGPNQSAIPNGTVANITFTIRSGAAVGSSSLSLGNAAATDPGGSSIPLSLSNGTLTVLTPPATNTPVTPPTETQMPTNTYTTTNTSPPPALPSPTRTRTSTATQSSPGSSTNTPTRTSAPGLSSPTMTNTQVATDQGPSSATSTTDLTATAATHDLTPTTTSNEVVLKELSQSIEMSIMATATALAELESQTAATGTALAEATFRTATTTERKVVGNRTSEDLMINLAVLGLGVGALGAVIYGLRIFRIRRGEAKIQSGSPTEETNKVDNQER